MQRLRAGVKQVHGTEAVLAVVVLLVLVYLTIPPLFLMFWKSFVSGISLGTHFSLNGYRSMIENGLSATVVQTLEFALGSTIVTLVIGSIIAWSTIRTDSAMRWLGYVVAFLGFAVPGLVNIIGWIILFGNGSGVGDLWLRHLTGLHLAFNIETLPGMIVMEGLLNVPVVFFLLIGPLRSFNASFEEAAQVHGGRGITVMRKVTIPLLKPVLLSAVILIAIRAIQSFEVPVLLGTPARTSIFTAEIYQSIHSSIIPDYSTAAAFGVVLVAGLIVLLMIETRFTKGTKRFEVISGRGTVDRTTRLGRFRWLPTILNLIILAFFLLPCFYVVLASFQKRIGASIGAGSFTLSNYATLLHTSGFMTAIRDTVEVALLAAIATALLTLLASWVSVRGKGTLARLVNFMANIPLVIPGIVMGFGFLLFYLYSPVPLFGTLLAIGLAFVAMFVPYGIRYVRPALIGISGELEEAARISGASGRHILFKIVLPLVKSSVTGTSLYVFFTSFRELAMASILVTAATPLLSTLLLDQLVNGDLTVVSALGALIFIVSALVGLLAFRFIGFQRVSPVPVPMGDAS
ncbi:MAG: iron ABC transporter permease [Actinomycetota bacterium]|nr:MAG: iron ABC transporter permease [Actinomycetota bacterium]